jgi:hypothetical protein
MSLKVIDGLMTLDGANYKIDIPYQAVTAAATVNSTGVDMSAHSEFLAAFLGAAVTGAGVLTCLVQESNEAAANFTNVTGGASNAVTTISAANTLKVMSVDWRSPLRKKYARLSVVAATNTVAVSAVGCRVSKKCGQSIDAAALQC